MDRGDGDARRSELPGHPVGTPLGTAEDERLAVMIDESGGDRDALGPLGPPKVVRDGFEGIGFGLDDATARIVLVRAADGFDLAAHRGGEEEDLSIDRCAVDQAPDRPEEAHVDHPVRLVEDDRFDAVEADVAAGDEIFEATRAGDHDVDTAAKGLTLVAVPDTAVDGDDPPPAGTEEGGEDPVHLLRKFAGGDEHQAARRARFGALDGTGHQREGVCKGLAGAGWRLSADVPACQCVADRRGLNREGVGDPERVEALRDGRADAEIEK